jgi:hypothetical protein
LAGGGKVVDQIQEPRNGVPGPWFVIIQEPDKEGNLHHEPGHADEVRAKMSQKSRPDNSKAVGVQVRHTAQAL